MINLPFNLETDAVAPALVPRATEPPLSLKVILALLRMALRARSTIAIRSVAVHRNC